VYNATDCVALLSWDPVEGATSYRVAWAGGGARETFDVPLKTQTVLQWTRGDLEVTIEAIDAEGPGARTAPLRVPEAMPDFEISISGTTAQLSWAAEASPARVARGPTRETMAVLATVSGATGYTDEGLVPGSTYFWAVQFGQPPLSFVPAVKSRTVPLG
jgi:hypothetical protein